MPYCVSYIFFQFSVEEGRHFTLRGEWCGVDNHIYLLQGPYLSLHVLILRGTKTKELGRG